MIKMIQYMNFIFFENEADFLENTRANDPYNRFYINGGYIDKKPTSFPATFHYISSDCPGFCGYWELTNKLDFSSLLRCRANELNRLAEQIEKS